MCHTSGYLKQPKRETMDAGLYPVTIVFEGQQNFTINTVEDQEFPLHYTITVGHPKIEYMMDFSPTLLPENATRERLREFITLIQGLDDAARTLILDEVMKAWIQLPLHDGPLNGQ